MIERVLFVHNYYRNRGGEASVLESEAAVLREAGVRVSLFTRDSARAGPGTFVRSLGGLYSSRAKASLVASISDFRPDLVHVHNAHPLITDAAYDAADQAGVPLIHTVHNYRMVCCNAILFREGQICERCVGNRGVHGVVHRCYRGSLGASLLVTAANQVRLRRAGAGAWPGVTWVALSSLGRDLLVRAGFPSDQVLVKGNFLADDHLHPVAGDRDGYLFVGRLSTEKGIEDVMAAWASGLSHRLTIIGDGPLADQVRRWADGVPHVNFLGRQPRDAVLSEMARHRALLFPSRWYEGFPMVLLEGMAHGMAIVSTGLGTVPDIAPEGAVALQYPSGDAHALRACIAAVSPASLQALGKAAKERFDRLYSREQGTRSLMELYEQVVQRHSGTASGS